jgi:hypothetical protein
MLQNDIFYYDEKQVFTNRNDAVRSGNKCNFYYYDDAFSKMDWSKEPKESLPELYRRRAQQIRDQYNHVVICYSGGIDSTQMLETFYYNNIHIDEILIVGALSQDPRFGSDQNHNADLYYNAFPTVNDLHFPNTKISFVDYTKYFDNLNNFTLLEKHGAEYTEHIGVRTSLHNLFWYDLDKFLGHKKKTAYVMGKEKPILKYDGLLQKYYACFSDISYTDYGNRYDYGVGDRINFYSHPDAFDVMLKQYYMIKNQNEYVKTVTSSTENIFENYLDKIKPIIYNLKNPLKHQSLKSKSTYLSARDMFILEKKNSNIYEMYGKAIARLNQTIDITEKFVFESKPYYLT